MITTRAPDGANKLSFYFFCFITDFSANRLPSTLMTVMSLMTWRPAWSGRRPASFLQQGLDCELQWLTMFFMSPVVKNLMMASASTPSCRGILPPRPGNQPARWPWGDPAMQPLLFHLRFYHLSQESRCFFLSTKTKDSTYFKIFPLIHFKIFCLLSCPG